MCEIIGALVELVERERERVFFYIPDTGIPATTYMYRILNIRKMFNVAKDVIHVHM